MTVSINRGRCTTFSAVLAALAISTTGCHVEQSDAPTPSTDPARATQRLSSLPSLEDTRFQLESAISDITSAATREVPHIVWTTATNADSGSCPAPYDQTDGQSAYLANRVAEQVSVSDRQWSDLLQVARAAATKVGATDEQVMEDKPGKHDVWFSGPAGLFLKFSYKGNMVVAGYTGCRLPGGRSSG